MILTGLLLLGVAVVDLARRPRAPRGLPEAAGVLAAVGLGLLAGVTGVELLALLAVGVVVAAWGWTVARVETGARPWLPLVVLGAGVLATLLLRAADGGPLASLLAGHPWPLLADLTPARLVLVLGVALAQISTGNVLVRLALETTGTQARSGQPSGSGGLRGGRLLGPMERLLIVGFGLAGNLTAASIVVAAKGLLRFPELSSGKKDQENLHRMTEYFLVGSFLSWLIAFGGLMLLAT